MLRVVHRHDNLLQRNVAEAEAQKASGEPDPYAGTYIGKYTTPIHDALLKFLDAGLVEKEFENEEQIKDVIFRWPQFLRDNTNIREDHIFKEWSLYISRDGNICANTGGMGGDFWVASIETVEAKEEAPMQANA